MPAAPGISPARFKVSSALGIYLLGLQPRIRRGLSCPARKTSRSPLSLSPSASPGLGRERGFPFLPDPEDHRRLPKTPQSPTANTRRGGTSYPIPPSSGSILGCRHLPGPPGSSETMLRHLCVGRAGGCCLPRAKERAGGPLNFNKSHSQLCVPVFPVDRVPNHHQKQHQHPEYLPSCVPRDGVGEEKKHRQAGTLGFG